MLHRAETERSLHQAAAERSFPRAGAEGKHYGPERRLQACTEQSLHILGTGKTLDTSGTESNLAVTEALVLFGFESVQVAAQLEFGARFLALSLCLALAGFEEFPRACSHTAALDTSCAAPRLEAASKVLPQLVPPHIAVRTAACSRKMEPVLV